MMHEWWNGTWMGGGMFLGPLLMLLVLGLAIAGLVLLLRGTTGQGRQHEGGRQLTAREILDQRYARGEIDKAEYETRRKTLAEGG